MHIVPIFFPRSAIETAKSVAADLRDDFVIKRMKFDGFGKEGIKRMVGLHPDTFVQVCLQLAYHRMHGKPGECRVVH